MNIHEYRKIRWTNKDPIPGSDGLYHQVIEIRNLYNGRIYVAFHSTTNPNDDFMGSGVAVDRCYKRFGKAAFMKRILHYAQNSDELDFYQRIIVDEEFVKSSHTYNVYRGGRRKTKTMKQEKNTKITNTKKSNDIKVNTNSDNIKIENKQLNDKNEELQNSSFIISFVTLVVKTFKHILWHLYQIISII